MSAISVDPAVKTGPLFGRNQKSDSKKRRFIRKVTVENFRGIDNAVIEFPDHRFSSDKKVGSIVILGENAVGKTCALQAAALGAMGPEKAAFAEIDPDWCLRDGCDSGSVKVEFWDTEDFNSISFERHFPNFTGYQAVDVVVLAYGAYRLPARRALTERSGGYEFRVQTLFDERGLVGGPFGLIRHFRSALGDLNHDKITDATRALNALLLGAARAKIVDGSRLVIEEEGRDQSLDRLSSGYKSIVSIATDLMDVMYGAWDGITSGQALVLIDELDAHLHPTWRMRVVESLRATFPMAQFLITTHDPLILRGLDSDELLVLERDDEGQLQFNRPRIAAVEGMNIDQLLTSELFGLNTTLDSTLADALTKYYTLLSKIDKSDNESIELESLEEMLRRRRQMGETQRERILYQIIDRQLARHKEARGGDLIGEDIIEALLAEVDAAELDVSES